MKKVLVSVIAAAAVSGCAGYYDYYNGNVRYTQDGKDCVYYSTDNARHYTSDVSAVDANKKIVYKNTKCSDLYASDYAGNVPMPQRKVLTPAATTQTPEVVEVRPACEKTTTVVKRRYVIVPAM